MLGVVPTRELERLASSGDPLTHDDPKIHSRTADLYKHGERDTKCPGLISNRSLDLCEFLDAFEKHASLLVFLPEDIRHNLGFGMIEWGLTPESGDWGILGLITSRDLNKSEFN